MATTRLVHLIRLAAIAGLLAGFGSVNPPPSATAPPASAETSPIATAEPQARNPAVYEEGAPYAVELDPADFVTGIDNPYLPWVPGTRFVYRGGGERVVVTVLPETRTILGIEATVVHDQVFEDGELTEDTFDWYAQDREGNVWHLGESTEELVNGVSTTTAGSWEAGVGGAQPGIVMLADPQVGDTYRQEYLAGEAEDLARVHEIGTSVKVLGEQTEDTITTEEWTPLEPDVVEHKTYARGIGDVLDRTVQGGKGVVRLVDIQRP